MKTINELLYSVVKAQMVKLCVDIGYSGKVELILEQSFKGLQQQLEPDTIYFVLKFNQGTIVVGGLVQPATIEIISESNSIDNAFNVALNYTMKYTYVVPSQQFLGEYKQAFIQQAYSTPSASENFKEVYGDFKSILSIESTFVYADNVSGVSSIKVDNEEIIFTSVEFGLQNTPNSANLGDNNGRVKSINKFGVFTLSFNTVSLGSAFIKKVDGIAIGTLSINTPFNVKIVKNGVLYEKNLKIINPHFIQPTGTIPTYTLAFTE